MQTASSLSSFSYGRKWASGRARGRRISTEATYEPGVLPVVSRPFRRCFCRAPRQRWLGRALRKTHSCISPGRWNH